ncbi:periplasmic binding family protein [Clostridium argentinense CDC 2741]|uniref:Periplasmic binding family protein n=1 Tax=Clostridium argentinense CDC 2741 TaxID=1418104 RepID=A0A0C1ULT9_9CLOT|nr:ABC transporter substrate-binding protein [Clostridium argentinense]ARC84823.1 iron ABC transporter substrate-binding protein [Clostridium argentinense]KIE48200.1 periplasmic binding family protein [Clostridium argentinense CDC 2741]NFF41138.1 ABC transporter substrate-binding protein [Clostridium argentinense]NFP51576.1 ABC transporter substrate-binding protein [Clostridium argentinense]NFP74059.1 ABC transporter substrate-binding protein [Clostridium argentinense]
MNKKFIIPICLILAIVMTACSFIENNSQTSGKSTNSVNQGNETIIVEDMKGDVEIPANPQRIVDVSGSADELIILEMPFIASANTSMFDGVTVPDYLQEYFTGNNVETVGNYSGASASGDLNLEKIAELNPDLIIMNIRHEKVYEQLKSISPTVMLSDDMSFVNWKGRFQQLGKWFGKEKIVDSWLEDYDAKTAELAAKVRKVVGDETFAVIEANSVHFGSYYVYRTGGPGELIFDAMKLPPSAGTPEVVWGEVVDAEYFSKIDADHIFFFSDDGKVGDTENNPTWQNLKAVKNGNVYYGLNDEQYDMAYTPNGKLLYMEKMANAIINHTNVE